MADPARAPGTHNIIKHPKHVGVCLECGAKGDWELIRSVACPKNPLPNSTRADRLPLAGAAKEATSSPVITSEAEVMQLLRDEELALQLLQEELDLQELEEQCSMLQDLEQEELQLKGMLEKESSSAKPGGRPPATPCSASACPKPADPCRPLPPVECHLAYRATCFVCQNLLPSKA